MKSGKDRRRTRRGRAPLPEGERKDRLVQTRVDENLDEALRDAAKQRRAIQALVTLGDPRTPDALLDRLENDPTGTALADDLLRAAGNFRRAESAEHANGDSAYDRGLPDELPALDRGTDHRG